MYTAVQSQKAVSAHFTSKQILPSGLAKQYDTQARHDVTDGAVNPNYYNQANIHFRLKGHLNIRRL